MHWITRFAGFNPLLGHDQARSSLANEIVYGEFTVASYRFI
jgi:hypothetical protein